MQSEFSREGVRMAKAARAKRTTKPASKRNTAKKNKPTPRETKPRAVKAELKYIPWSSVQLEDLNPLLQRQFVVGQDVMLARVLLKKGCIVPEHSHHNEQITYILDGALKFWIDGRVIVVNAGEVLTIPPHMPHKAEALEDTVDLDVFNPPRADWINKTDQYLRGGK
jgi:quercetin dioxygenase-like cupin family protein